MFTEAVKQAMNREQINAAELARQTGYSAMYLHNLLHDKRRWNEETMSKVCSVLNLELSVKPSK
jgi:DNA-binding phage protein